MENTTTVNSSPISRSAVSTSGEARQTRNISIGLIKEEDSFMNAFGDAPVHTLNVAMFLPKSEIWFFRDIGYQHDANHQCPPRSGARCSCEPTSIDDNFYKLMPQQSPQMKPQDTCIRQFLGDGWLEKKDGWSSIAEKSLGGDGYHGYKMWDY